MNDFLKKLHDATKGFKTKTSVVVIAVCAILQYLNLVDQNTIDLIMKLASGLGLYGIYDNVAAPK